MRFKRRHCCFPWPCTTIAPVAENECEEIIAEGLTCKKFEEYDKSSPGTIFDQYPEAGEKVTCGSEVNIFVSLGCGDYFR